MPDCMSRHIFAHVMGLLGSIGALDTLPGVVSITCILYCVRMCSRMLTSFRPQSCIDTQQSRKHQMLTEPVCAPRAMHPHPVEICVVAAARAAHAPIM